MRDLAIIEQKPPSGFRFCTIDVYALNKAGEGKLSGTYDSEACNDHATLELTPLEPVKPAEKAEPTEPPKSEAPEAPEPSDAPATKPQPNAAGGCTCGAAPLAVLPLFGLRRLRRPARSSVG